MGAAGAFYVQVFHYIDPGIAFGPHVSVEALVGAIVGGMGTLWGPVLGAAALHALGEATRNLFGNLPGFNLVIYGAVLVVIVMFMPRGWRARARAARALAARRPWLSRCSNCHGVSIAFGGLRAVQDVSLRAARRHARRADRPQRRGQDHAVRADVGLSQARQRPRALRRPRHHRPRAAPQCARLG